MSCLINYQPVKPDTDRLRLLYENEYHLVNKNIVLN